ncbi:glyoxylate reductase/hydroxypyruvate reductase-like [Saccostrea echinata]|uniref:glyoxylate reductase/hydroxypyruvate reductase-like n=1 Tax=Saccostrea echinata TaxID=191078 RepID=UPI002A7F1160|nr:glyoxylate reductase/hydroxypyruvate reductase-like [Saccostrea echinata]
MPEHRVYITRQVGQEALSILKGKCAVELWDSEDPIPKETLLKAVKGAAALFCTVSDTIDKDVLEAAGPCLKVVATMSAGTDNIDVSECCRRGIEVCKTPDIAADAAADIAVALILMTSRKIVQGIDAIRQNDFHCWKPFWLCGMGLINKTIGILGFGRVGFGIARRMKPFGVKRIIYHDVEEVEYAENCADYVSLDTLFSSADILCICCGVTAVTKGMVDTKLIQRMKKTSILINTSRGVIINHDDLADALKDGTIAAAGLDVTDPEPLPVGHPLLSQPNCVILPHMGTNTTETRIAMSTNTAKNILAVLSAL